MKIREMKGKDLEFIMSAASSAGSEPSEIKEILKKDEVFVAESDNKFAGFISIRRKDLVSEITGLAAVPQFQKKGFARELLMYVRELAKSRGAKELWVRTSNDNIPALTLYQKFGFKIADVKAGALVEHHGGEIPGWKGIPVRDEVLLKLKLE